MSGTERRPDTQKATDTDLHFMHVVTNLVAVLVVEVHAAAAQSAEGGLAVPLCNEFGFDGTRRLANKGLRRVERRPVAGLGDTPW